MDTGELSFEKEFIFGTRIEISPITGSAWSIGWMFAAPGCYFLRLERPLENSNLPWGLINKRECPGESTPISSKSSFEPFDLKECASESSVKLT